MNHPLLLFLALTSFFFFLHSSSSSSSAAAAADYEYSSSNSVHPENLFIAPASPSSSSSVQEEPHNIRAQNLAISRIDEALSLLSAMINDNSVTDRLAARCNTDMQFVQGSVLQAGQSLQDGKVEDAKRELSLVVDLFNECLASIDSSSSSSSVARIRKTLKRVASCISNAEELLIIGAATSKKINATIDGSNENSSDASINRTDDDRDTIPIANINDSESAYSTPNVAAEEEQVADVVSNSDKPTFVVEYCSDHVNLASNSAVIRVDRACGAKLRSDKKYAGGVFSARIRTPVKGSGIISSFYVSSNDPSSTDSISFDFIGKYPNRVLCSYSANGNSRGNQQLFVLAYDTSVDFHMYTIKWDSDRIQWCVDDVLLRTTLNERNNNDKMKKNNESSSSSIRGFPKEAGNIFVEAWDASSVGDGKYAGQVKNWMLAPFMTYFSDITVSNSSSSNSQRSSSSEEEESDASASFIIPVPVRPLAIDSLLSNVDVSANDITLSYDPHQLRSGGRFRSVSTYTSGTFIARFKCGAGITTSGLSSSFYLSSIALVEHGGSGPVRGDEIHFRWQAKDKSSVQTDYFVNGVGRHESAVALGFDCAQSFHTYTIVYESDEIQWLVDSKLVRVVKRGIGEEEEEDGGAFPEKPVYVFGSLRNESESESTTTTSSGSLAVDDDDDDGGTLPYTVYFSDVRIKSP